MKMPESFEELVDIDKTPKRKRHTRKHKHVHNESHSPTKAHKCSDDEDSISSHDTPNNFNIFVGGLNQS